MKNNIMDEENIKSPLKVIFVLYVGKNTDNEYIYHLLITIDSEKTCYSIKYLALFLD